MAYQTIYPYTNEVLHTFDNMTDQGLADVLERAHLLYKKWRKEDHLEERKAQLHQVANILRRDRDKYAEIMTKDMGKLFTEAQGEVDLCADIADYYADKADEFSLLSNHAGLCAKLYCWKPNGFKTRFYLPTLCPIFRRISS
ncbi:succinate-semialdehyde dehydrogenase [Streptococcus pyogenes]|nr:succinate-semialdehyde dehydrogenase [Streptococcus pyogenes]VGW86985.1 succinate-semialdehyde dehydrogenase [Streptococcus pyogenes]VGX19031.1 succinate-semialdehyde dehydrogenase [Streptococcus pyogenes]VGZ02436.1 succinate-semialdehyde dehydrogenase [Streptococcus pyogenes]VGZ26087.1 succinate-semialdehyde dehydrogenase [Streptococcus pyogenes]